MIAKKRGIPLERLRRLIDVQELLGMNLEEMVSVVTEDLHEEPYTMDEVCNRGEKLLDLCTRRISRDIASVVLSLALY